MLAQLKLSFCTPSDGQPAVSPELWCFTRQDTLPPGLGTGAWSGPCQLGGHTSSVCLQTVGLTACTTRTTSPASPSCLKILFVGLSLELVPTLRPRGFPQEILKGIICTVMSSVLLKQWKRCTEVSLLWRVKTYSASCEKQMKNKIQHTSHTYRP